MPSSQPPQDQSFWERINANSPTCPRCHEPRYGSTAAPGSKVMSFGQRLKAEGERQRADAAERALVAQGGVTAAEETMGQATRTYEGEQALQDGIRQMAAQGWRVLSQSSHQPSSGVGRALTLGLVGALVFKPAIKFTVIFERLAPPAP